MSICQDIFVNLHLSVLKQQTFMNMIIDDILTREEGQTFDCKSFAIDPKGLAVTFVAMANADGGKIAVGISDRKREIEGVCSSEKHLNELLRVPYDYCNPTVKATFDLIDCTNRHGEPDKILLFHIQPSVVLHATQSDECYVRIGDKSRKLTFMERMQLMYDKGVQSFEDTPVSDATIDDLDLTAVKHYMDVLGYGKSVMEFLTENHDYVKESDLGLRISAAAILLFGKNPQRFFPRARIRFIKYRGIEEKVGAEMNVVKDITIDGTILNQINKMVELLELQIDEPTYLGQDGRFVTKREYPHFVLQELTVNAECHRDYAIRGTEIQVKMFDDRLVFESPGTLPGNVKPDNIRHTHFSRNPHIAQFLKAYKFVKEFGEGVDRMSREMEAVDMLPPTFHLDAFILKVTARAWPPGNGIKKDDNVPVREQVREQAGEQVREQVRIVLVAISESELSVKEIMSVLGLSGRRNFVERYLSPALTDGVIESTNPNRPTSPNQKYRLTAKGKSIIKTLGKS